MSEDKNINISLVPKFADKALENVLEQPSKGIGNSFNDIWFLTLGGPIGQLAEKRKLKYAADLEEYKKKIEEEIEKIPNERRCEADIQVVGPVLEASKYCAEKEDLRNMYAKLIASSVDVDKKELVHPIFTDIISRMTVLDAKVFKDISGCVDDKVDFICDVEKISFSFVTLLQLGLIRNMSEKDEDYITITSYIESEYRRKAPIFIRFDYETLQDELRKIIEERRDNTKFFYDILKKEFALSRLGYKFKEICL